LGAKLPVRFVLGFTDGEGVVTPDKPSAAAALEGKCLDAVYSRLAETFDREPVMKSYQRYAAEMSGRQLRMGATGLLTATASSTGRRVRDHTFYGHGHLTRG
jgi:hypothetical protein